MWMCKKRSALVKKESYWSVKGPYTSLLWPYCLYFDKNRSGVLKWFQDRLLLPCSCRVKENGYKMQEIWPNWLPIFGHALTTTHIYNLDDTSLRLMVCIICPVCVHGPLPGSWLSWASWWTSCMHKDPIKLLLPFWALMQLVNTGRWLSFSPSLWPVLVFYCRGRSKFTAATMSRIQIIMLVLYKKCWCSSSASSACSSSASSAPYV